MQVKDTTILVAAGAITGFIVGFAYGNLFSTEYYFQFKDWQTTGSMLVALVAATAAYFGVQNTQRINVMTKEQDRLDEMLPGLREVKEFLLIIQTLLGSLRPGHREIALGLLDSALEIQPNESVEEAVRRKLPLANEDLKDEVAAIVFVLRSQAQMLKVGRQEVYNYQKDVANIHTFAPAAHEGLRETSARVEANYEREEYNMGKHIAALNQFADVIKHRIERAEGRQRIIEKFIDKFFKDE